MIELTKYHKNETKELTWHDDNSVFGLQNQGDKKTNSNMTKRHESYVRNQGDFSIMTHSRAAV